MMDTNLPAPTAQFQIDNYDQKEIGGKLIIQIGGRRSGKPSKRLTLKRADIRVESAKIICTQKNKTVEHTVVRINRLPTVGQTRLHSSSLLYPGQYQIQLTVKDASKLDGLEDLFA